MFKRVLQLSSGFVIAIAMSGALNVHAADDTRTATTQASISLKAGGNVTLDSAPDFDFPSTTIDANDTTTAKLSIAENKSNVLQVTNPGLASGWEVTAKLGQFTSTDGSRQLKGAILGLSTSSDFSGTGSLAGNSHSELGVATTKNNASVFGNPTDTINTDSKTTEKIIPNANATVHGMTLVAGGAEDYGFYALATQGVGIWQTAYDAALNIPAGNVEGTYKADLTWTLTNAPTV